MKEVQTINKRETKEIYNWGFRQPTILIESQSAPVLYGDPIEQKYMRAFVLANEQDLVITDFELNKIYLEDYLSNTLNFNLPKFLVVQNNGGNSLSENILNDSNIHRQISEWRNVVNSKARIQFFNITDSELEVSKHLGLESTTGDLEKAIQLGSKPGFRRFCEANDIPIAAGFVCSDINSTVSSIKKLFEKVDRVLIKAENGTGGKELCSNVVIDKKTWQELGLSYVTLKFNELDGFIGNNWVVEEFVEGPEGSIHLYISDETNADEPFAIGAISKNTSYVGGYWPYNYNGNDKEMISVVIEKVIPRLQEMGVFGYHCLDFKGGKFLEDNIRQGALDFIHGMVSRISQNFFPSERYHWWHTHISLNKKTSFEEIWEKYSDLLIPGFNKNHLAVITNPEVLPYGRDLDLTAVSYGENSSLNKAFDHFNKVRNILKHN